jgi:hypothetical protein
MYTLEQFFIQGRFECPELSSCAPPTGAWVLALGLSCVLMAGCAGGSATGGGGIVTPPANAPLLTAISPSTALIGSTADTLIAYGSNFTDGVTIEWNGTALATTCVDANPIATGCSTATELMATVPASDFATLGSEQVSLSNPEPDGGTSNAISFKVAAAPAPATWVRAVAGVTVGWDMVWDSVHNSLYVSTAVQDPKYPDMLVPINPVSGTAGTAAPAESDPEYLSLSSDSSYPWASLFGSNSVQRYVVPGFAKDISIPVPMDLYGRTQEAVNIQAAPVSPHTLAMVAGDAGGGAAGDGVYIYDDATARPMWLPGFESGGPVTDLLQWGNDDSTLYSIQNLAGGGDGIFPLQVTFSGVTWNKTGGGLPVGLSYYNRQNGLTYAWDGVGVYDATGDTLIGQFDVPEPDTACTADATLNRYYCLTVYSNSGVDVYQSELWVFNLSTYALIERIYFGSLQGASGAEFGLPSSAWTYGAGGVFLIDGAAVNPNAAPDVATGTSTAAYAQLSSLSPQSATAGSGNVSVTINGSNFSPDSTACWNCNALQERLLPTTYVNSTQLNVLIPASQLATAQPLAISILDQSTSLFSTNGRTFTVLPTPGSTKVTPLNLAGLSMAWDEASQLLYVGTQITMAATRIRSLREVVGRSRAARAGVGAAAVEAALEERDSGCGAQPVDLTREPVARRNERAGIERWGRGDVTGMDQHTDFKMVCLSSNRSTMIVNVVPATSAFRQLQFSDVANSAGVEAM